MGGGPSKMKFKRGQSNRHKEAIKYVERQEKMLGPIAKAPTIVIDSDSDSDSDSSLSKLDFGEEWAGSSQRQPSASPRCHSGAVGLEQPSVSPRCLSPASAQRQPSLRAAAKGDDRAMLKASNGWRQPDLPHAVHENTLLTPFANPCLEGRSRGRTAREQKAITYNNAISPRSGHPPSPSPRGTRSEPPMPAACEDEPKAPPSGTWDGAIKEYGAERKISRELIFQEDGVIKGRGGNTDPGAQVSGKCNVSTETLSWMEIHPWGKLNLQGSVMFKDGTYVIKGSFSTSEQSRGPVELRFVAGSSRRRSA